MTRSRAQEAPPAIIGFVLPMPAIRDEHIDVGGIYFGATLFDYTKPWPSYALFEGTSIDSNFIQRASCTDRMVAGIVIAYTELTVDYRLIDYANTITLKMCHPDDALENVTEQEMLFGRNRFVVGGEIIGAANCELTATDEFSGCRTYELSTLVRGQLGTFSVGKMLQFPGNLAVRLDGAGVNFLPHAPSRVGETAYYKFVAGGGNVVTAATIPVALDGKTLTPLVPVSIQGTRDGSNNLTVTWERHGRRSLQTLDQRVPWDAEIERYKIDVLAASGSPTSLRTTIVSEARTWTYTASNQIIDGLTPGDTVVLVMSQMGTIVQDGEQTEVTV